MERLKKGKQKKAGNKAMRHKERLKKNRIGKRKAKLPDKEDNKKG